MTTALLAAAVTLAGCTSTGLSGVQSIPDNPGQGGAPAAGTPQGGVPLPETRELADGSASATVDAADVATVDAADRSVVTTGSMTVTAEDPLAAASEATAVVERAGGRVDARSETAPTKRQRGAATLTVRVPSATLTSTLDELKKLGTAQNVSLGSTDVTMQTRDLAARISASRASVDRLTALLATATDTETLIELESAISARQGDLESMEAQQRDLADQVSLSTIELSLISVTDAPVEQPDTFWSGLAAGWGAFAGFVGFVIVAAGVLLPWALVGAIVAVVVAAAVRRRARRRAVAEPAG